MFRSTFAVPLTLFALTAFVSEYFSYEREYRGLQFVLLLAAISVHFIVAWHMEVRPKTTSRQMATLLLIGAACLTAYYFIGAVYQSLPALFNPNVVAGVNGFVLPYCLILRRYKASQNWATALAVWLMLGLLLAGASGAILAWVVVCAIGAGWWYFRPNPSKNILRIVTVALPVGTVLAVIVLFGWLNTILQALPLHSRTHAYRQSEALVMAHPFVGSGLGAFDMLHATYSLLTHVPFLQHAHNLYLDISLAQGGIGLLIFVWMVAQFFSASLHKAYCTHRFAAQLSLLFLLLHGLLDDPLYSWFTVVLLFIPYAFLGSVPRATTRRFNFALGGLLIAIGVLSFLSPQMKSAAYANWGAIQQARTELTLYDRYRHWMQDEVRGSADLTTSIAAYERALQLDATNITANFRLGQIALAKRDYAAALNYLSRAEEGNSADSATRQLLGEVLIITGNEAAGAAFWQSVYQEQGQLRLRLDWYEYIDEMALYARLAAAIP